MTTRVSRVDSKALRIALVATVLAIGWLVLRDESDVLVGMTERIQVRIATAARTAAIAAERCPRPALREPATGDGSPLLAGIIDLTSPEERCLAAASKLRFEVEGCPNGSKCTRRTLAAMPPAPEIVAACEPLYTKIAQLAHTTEACSPSSGVADPVNLPDGHFMPSLPFAIQSQVAPLFTRGELLAAARHITDAMRFVDDYARKGYAMQQMMSLWVIGGLGEALDDILTDPRLTAEEAREVARDLDVLLASAPPVDAMIRQESRFIVYITDARARGDAPYASPSDDETYTGDRDQDAVLELIGIERWLQRVEQACERKPLRACLAWFRAQAEPDPTKQLERVRVARMIGVDRDTLRETILDSMRDAYGFWAMFSAGFGARQFELTALRVQAELRTMTVEECRDPYVRRTRLARWLDDVVLGDEPEPIVDRQAWQTRPAWTRRKPSPSPRRTLACIERK